jgi:hypothetical protein
MHRFARILIGAPVLTLALAQPAASQVTLIDSPTTIDYAISGNVRIGSINPDPFTVNLVNGGSVSNVLSTRNQSTLNMTGGVVESQLTSRNTSTINLSGGYIGLSFIPVTGFAFALDSSVFNFSGGTIQNGLQVHNDATLNWSGGTVGGAAFALNNSVLNFTGGAFTGAYTLQTYDNSTINVRGGGSGFNTIFASGESLLNFYGYGLTSTPLDNDAYRVTGNLLDGSVANFYITPLSDVRNYRVTVFNVPEPGTAALLMALLGSGLWIRRRRSR